ncbi:CGNR zinc finger domain-containing protein [Georgenia alba]|uniref:CGNR zinc finger domain-containing protein n=1 Tax=Georgenia alba TaxID=2233858 RepID=A0ABW2Q8K4_9MICO
MVTVPRVEMADVLELVNTYGRVPRATAQDQGEGYPALSAVMADNAERFPGTELEHLQALADEAYQVFAAAHEGGDVADRVNALLAPASPTPTCTPECGIEWEVADAADALRAALGVALLDFLHTRGAERLGTCKGIRCADAFADLSPSGRKLFCSSGCLNRHKVAEHRRRAKASA